MATFELERPPLIDAVREWRAVRSLPLYAGGLLGGLAIGLSIAAATSQGTSSREAMPSYSGMEVGIAASPAPFANEAERDVNFIYPYINAADPPIGGVDLPRFDLTLPPLAEAEPVEPVMPIQPAAAPAAPAAPSKPAPAASLPQTQPVPQAQPAPQAQPDPAPAAPPAPAPEPAKPNFYVPAVSSGPLNSLEQRFFAAANNERAAAGLAPLTLDSTLTLIARTRSQQLVDQGYFGHTDPYGYSMYVELLSHFGIQWYAWAGENLAMNNYAESESPERAMVALMNSPTHKRNILATEFNRLGVGLVTMADGRKYYTMIFLG